MLKWTPRYVDHFESVALFFSHAYPGVELLGYVTVLFLVFWEASILFSKVAAPIYIPSNSVRGFPFLHTLSNICYLPFLMMTILTVLSWYLIKVFTCISLMTSVVEHHLMCLLTFCILSLEKCLFSSIFNQVIKKNEILPFVATWMNLEVIRLYCVESFISII